MKTIAEAKAWAALNRADLDADRLASKHPYVQKMNRLMPEVCRALWDSGSWLRHQLEAVGATEKQITDLQFAQGQRSFGGEPWAAAVGYVNEFLATGDTKDKPGLQLADQLIDERFPGLRRNA